MAYSVYDYLRPSELAAYISSMASVTDEDLAAFFIGQAERIIDAYVGPGPKFYYEIGGEVAATVASGSAVLTSTSFGDRRPNYWSIGGTYLTVVSASDSSLNGERRKVVSSLNPNTVTLASGFSADLVAGAQFRFCQESQFPRAWDQDSWGNPYIDEMLKAAVAAQVEYGIAYGSEGFGLGDSSVIADTDGDVTARTYGSGYSESRDPRRKEGMAVWVAPIARVFLRRLLGAAGYMR